MLRPQHKEIAINQIDEVSNYYCNLKKITKRTVLELARRHSEEGTHHGIGTVTTWVISNDIVEILSEGTTVGRLAFHIHPSKTTETPFSVKQCRVSPRWLILAKQS